MANVPADVDFAEMCIVASVTEDGSLASPVISPTEHHKCGRCWRLLPEVTEDGSLCGRCEDVLA
jgi:isoleucyl-tRNA synthetase